MKTKSGVTILSCVSLATVGIIYYVHWSQKQEKQRMREGIERDEERLKLKKEKREQP